MGTTDGPWAGCGEMFHVVRERRNLKEMINSNHLRESSIRFHVVGKDTERPRRVEFTTYKRLDHVVG